MTVFLRLVLIVLLSCGLIGCGQKGPLQRPDQTAFAASVR
ncbi:MAG: lipoprotein [Pseudomonadales bacterium]|nr:lipoprotein [Pseudomonadales bacterium]MCP5357151.1 lipoprotein [Pseudomonadales bacterium]